MGFQISNFKGWFLYTLSANQLISLSFQSLIPMAAQPCWQLRRSARIPWSFLPPWRRELAEVIQHLYSNPVHQENETRRRPGVRSTSIQSFTMKYTCRPVPFTFHCTLLPTIYDERRSPPANPTLLSTSCRYQDCGDGFVRSSLSELPPPPTGGPRGGIDDINVGGN